jgi:hypothetical protein
MRIVGQMEDIKGKLSALKIVQFVGCPLYPWVLEVRQKISRIFSRLIFLAFSAYIVFSKEFL